MSLRRTQSTGCPNPIAVPVAALSPRLRRCAASARFSWQNLFVGTAGTGMRMHRDMLVAHVWAVQQSGSAATAKSSSLHARPLQHDARAARGDQTKRAGADWRAIRGTGFPGWMRRSKRFVFCPESAAPLLTSPDGMVRVDAFNRSSWPAAFEPLSCFHVELHPGDLVTALPRQPHTPRPIHHHQQLDTPSTHHQLYSCRQLLQTCRRPSDRRVTPAQVHWPSRWLHQSLNTERSVAVSSFSLDEGLAEAFFESVPYSPSRAAHPPILCFAGRRSWMPGRV